MWRDNPQRGTIPDVRGAGPLERGAFDRKGFGCGVCCLAVTVARCLLTVITDPFLLFLSRARALSSHLSLLKSLRVLPVISISIRSSSYFPFIFLLRFPKCFFLGFIPQSTDILPVSFFFVLAEE